MRAAINPAALPPLPQPCHPLHLTPEARAQILQRALELRQRLAASRAARQPATAHHEEA